MRFPVHVARDDEALRGWIEAGVHTTATATFVSGTPAVTAGTGAVARSTASAAVSGLLVRLDTQEGIRDGRAAALAGGAAGIDALFWTEPPAGQVYDTRSSLVIGAETFEVVGIGDYPGLDHTKLLYLRRRS